MSIAATPFENLCQSQRPVPLKGRVDLIVETMDFQGVSHFVVKDAIGLTYQRLRADQYRVLRLLDGQRSLEEIRDTLASEFPALGPTVVETQQLIADLHQKGLAYTVRTGQAATRIEQHRKKRLQKIWNGLTNILSLRLPGWDPDQTLERMLPWVRWAFHPLTAIAAILFVAASWLLLAIHFREFQSRLPAFNQFFGWPNLIFLWCTLAGAKVVHEFGHGLSCKAFGRECHEMGVMLLVGSPCLYCDVSDAWMLKNKWKRILIGGAGMIVETVLSAVAIFLWWLTEPGLLHYLCLNLFFVSSISTVIFNANPLMRLDGYYMLSDLLEIPNLRQKSNALLHDLVAKWALGVETRADPFMPQTGKPWFILFAITSQIYGWFILGGILVFLYTVLKPYGLQSIGQTLALISVSGVVTGLIMSGYQMVTTRREKPLKKQRLAISLMLLATLAVAAGTIPIPWFGSAAFLIEPGDVQHVMTQLPGELVATHVRPGDHVEEGQLLAELLDPALDDRLHDLSTQIDVQQRALHAAIVMDNASERLIAHQAIASLRDQLRELNEQRRHLKIKAPISGTIIAPPRTPTPKNDQSKSRLSSWNGTPLDQKNQHAFLDEGTHLLSIAPSATMQAVLYLDQADRNEVMTGTPVGLKFEHLPHRVFRGNITTIATAQSDFAPEPLAVKYGGSLPTVTDRDQREKLNNAAYQATVSLDQSPELLRPNLRGEARFIAARRSLFDWAARFVGRTFHFQM